MCLWNWEKVEASVILQSNDIARCVHTQSACHSFSMSDRLPFDLPLISLNEMSVAYRFVVSPLLCCLKSRHFFLFSKKVKPGFWWRSDSFVQRSNLTAFVFLPIPRLFRFLLTVKIQRSTLQEHWNPCPSHENSYLFRFSTEKQSRAKSENHTLDLQGQTFQERTTKKKTKHVQFKILR